MRLLILVILLSFNVQAEWTQRADFGAEGRHRAVGIGIGNKGYFGLGHYNGAGPNIIKHDWWEYDPSTNAWTQKSDYPGGFGVGSYACLSFGMATYGFVGGGQYSNGNEFYKYTPATNSWTQVGNIPTSAMNLQGFAIDNIGYYLSGSTVYAYDADTDTWSTKNNAPFSVGIWNSAFVIDNKGYIKSSGSLWEYKPSIDQWIQRAPFPGLATAGSMSFAQRNKGYIVTGYSGALSEVNSEVWEFDPSNNSWLLLDEFPGTSRRFGASFEIGDRCYVGIGTNGTNFNDLWEFDRSLDVDQLDQLNVRIGPNPASEFLAIEVQNEHFKAELYTISGQYITSSSASGSLTMDLSPLESGQYLVRITLQDGSVASKKIVVL